MTTPETLETTCCIVGGGPAGVMLGYLLARAGVAVKVLEKHKDRRRRSSGGYLEKKLVIEPECAFAAYRELDLDELSLRDSIFAQLRRKVTTNPAQRVSFKM